MRFGETAKKILGLEPIPAYDEQLRQQAKLLGKGQSLEAPLGGIEDHLVAMPGAVVDFSAHQREADENADLIALEQRTKRVVDSLPKGFFDKNGVVTITVVSTTEYPETLAARLSETISNRREIGSYIVNPSSLHGHFEPDEPEHRVTRPITGKREPRVPLHVHDAGTERDVVGSDMDRSGRALSETETVPTYYLGYRGDIEQLITNSDRDRTNPKKPYTKVYESELEQLPGRRDRESVYVGLVGKLGDLDDRQRRMLVGPMKAILALGEQLEQHNTPTLKTDQTPRGPIHLY